MNNPISIVVLDCDGVILETVDIKTRAFAASVAEYGQSAVDWLVDYHLRFGGVSRHAKYMAFFREYLRRTPEDGELDRLAERFKAGAIEGVMLAPLVPGAEEFIRWASGHLPLYVASGAPQDELRFLLEIRKLSGYFKGIYGSPDLKPDILRRILENHGARPQELLMVGDSSTDLEAALEVGSRFYGRGGFAPRHPWGEDMSGLMSFVKKSSPAQEAARDS